MYLSKIEIFGFKSFPEKTKIEFDDRISAIVGPNGTGKSNIVDAIRWVLGEQGDRALRSEKREDVVFSGTKNRKPLSVAEVSLTVQNNKNIQHKNTDAGNRRSKAMLHTGAGWVGKIRLIKNGD